MASNGAEDIKTQGFGPALAVRARPAVIHTSSGEDSFGCVEPKEANTQAPHKTPVQTGVRVAKDRQFCVSGVPLHRAYLSMSAFSPSVAGADDILSFGSRSAKLFAQGGNSTNAVSKPPQCPRIPLVACYTPYHLATTNHSYRPSWHLDSVQLRSGLLGKKTLFSQFAVNPPCTSLLKSTSQKSSEIDEGMPTNQSLPWSMYKCKDSRKGTRTPSHPQQEPSDQAKAPLCPSSHMRPASPTPHCHANGDKESCCIPMEPPGGPGIDTRSCSCATVNPSGGSHACARHGSVSVTAREADSKRDSTKQPSIYSMTNQRPAVHLNENSPLSLDQESLFMLPEYGEEEELPDELENLCSGDEDDDSDCSSLNYSSTASMDVSLNIEEPVTSDLKGDRVKKPALVPSLFPFTPPTLYFGTDKEHVELLPVEQSKLLKWKMSSVTPSVVRQTIARSHFRVSRKSHDWLGCWGQHLKSRGFRAIQEHQKLNHFPGSFQIGRKDRLWQNLSKMQGRFGKHEFSFFPRTFVLPHDTKLLRKAWDRGRGRKRWIIKPPASARGNGIQVIHKWSQIPKRRPLLVQKYIHKPYLIGGNKFDLRIYVYVSSYDPLRIYIFTDGLVRFASCKYSSSMKTLGNKFIHLTNYSVNKKNSEYQSNGDDKACQGHKWALKALWQYLGARGVNTILIWEKIKDIVVKTIIVSDPYVNTLSKMYVRSPYCCHELFGFDIMLDEKLRPWLLEVNISPSLHTNTALDVKIKGQMIRDLLNLAGFVLPQSEERVPASSSSTTSSTSSLSGGERDRSKHTTELLLDERIKRAQFHSQRIVNQELFASVLTVLTPNDVRVLSQAEDELNRRGNFERVFPSPVSWRYMRFFEQRRYLNILLNQWELKYCHNRSKGINLLKGLCQKGVHLGSASAAHLWSSMSTLGFKAGSHANLSLKEEPMRPRLGVRQKQSALQEVDDLQSDRSSSPDTGSPSPSSSLSSDSLHAKDFD